MIREVIAEEDFGEIVDGLGLLKNFESSKIHVKAVVISDYSYASSHYTAKQTLSQWLSKHKVPGIYGVDTRAITKLLRQHGSLLGRIVVSDASVEFDDPNV